MCIYIYTHTYAHIYYIYLFRGKYVNYIYILQIEHQCILMLMCMSLSLITIYTCHSLCQDQTPHLFSPTHYIKYISTYPPEINSSITSKATIIEANQEKIYKNNKINNNKKVTQLKNEQRTSINIFAKEIQNIFLMRI